MNDSIVEYLADKQVSEQWRGFLSALSKTLALTQGMPELRGLMHAVGTQFGADNPLPTCRTLDDLELAMTKVWVEFNWGWASLEEGSESLRIRHACAPLSVAFGDPDLAWSGAFLEGVYQVWLSQLGAGPSLRVRQVPGEDDGLTAIFELRR